MRHIILLAPSEAVSGGGAGHLSRFVVGALLISHGARRDVRLDILFNGACGIGFDGGSMRNVRPDEQSLSGILKAGLRRARERGGGRIMQGIRTYGSGLEGLLDGAKGERIYFGGAGGRPAALCGDFCAVFQYPSLDGQSESLLMKAGFQRAGLGRRPLFPDQAVVILNNKADRLQAPG